MNFISDILRDQVTADERSVNTIAKLAKVPQSSLDSFVRGGDSRGATLSKLATFYGFTLVKRKGNKR